MHVETKIDSEKDQRYNKYNVLNEEYVVLGY